MTNETLMKVLKAGARVAAEATWWKAQAQRPEPSLSARQRAWNTRRARYGPSGHAGAYSRPPTSMLGRALSLIARLHNEGTLSEGQCCKALGMDRVEFRALCDQPQGETEGKGKGET